MDDEPAATGCATAFGFGIVSSGTMGRPAIDIHIGHDAAPPPLPACGVLPQIYNMELVTGASGTLAHDVEVIPGPLFFVDVPWTHESPDTCPSGGDEQGEITSGSWRVVEGGTWGDMVEVEVQDVVFAPMDGHALEIPYGHWRARLPAEPITHP